MKLLAFKNNILLLFFMFITLKGFCGDGVGNGGGISENNFIFVYNSIGQYIEHSLSVLENDFLKKERDVLEKIHRSLKDEYQTEKQIEFLSGRDFPHIFIYPFKEVRFAVTGSQVGSKIYINSDLLYKKINNQIFYIAIPQALSILIHEFGHHHEIKDELFLNTLGAKVAKSLNQKIEKRPLRLSQNIYLNFINLGQDNNVQVQLSDGFNSFNLSRDLQNKIKCPLGFGYKGVEIWQSSWSKYQHSTWYIKNELVLYCESDEEIIPLSQYSYYIYPSFIKKNNQIIIDQVKTFLKQCDERNTSCLAKQASVFEFINNKKNKMELK